MERGGFLKIIIIMHHQTVKKNTVNANKNPEGLMICSLDPDHYNLQVGTVPAAKPRLRRRISSILVCMCGHKGAMFCIVVLLQNLERVVYFSTWQK